VYEYDRATADWNKIQAPKAWSITADAEGTPWIRDHYDQSVLRYSYKNKSWSETGMKDAHYIDHGFALGG
jgi:hypothetical protein